MNISMNEEQMTALVSKAIFDGLTQQAKDEMLQKALRHLMTKDDRTYGTKRTPLEEAFQSAASQVTREIATQSLQADEAFKANIQGLFEELGKKLFEGPLREKLVERMAESVVENLRADR